MDVTPELNGAREHTWTWFSSPSRLEPPAEAHRCSRRFDHCNDAGYCLQPPARLDRAHYALKGGTNLRYFFGSPRYSEDIDLDALRVEPWHLEARIDETLASPVLDAILRTGGLSVSSGGKQQQTETTQRWKPGIAVAGRREPIRTRIEFSHGGSDHRPILEVVPDRVVAPYALRAPSVLHYTAEAAIQQKIAALALRSETQARDAFDLELLLRGLRGTTEQGVESETARAAAERVRELPFAAFRDQVLPFLDPNMAELHDRASWEQIRHFVARRLEELL